jgi:hypothetical protein
MKLKWLKVLAAATVTLLFLCALAFLNLNRGELPELQAFATSRDVSYQVFATGPTKASLIDLNGITLEDAIGRLEHLKKEGYTVRRVQNDNFTGAGFNDVVQQVFFSPRNHADRRISLVFKPSEGRLQAHVTQPVRRNDVMLLWTERIHPNRVSYIRASGVAGGGKPAPMTVPAAP